MPVQYHIPSIDQKTLQVLLHRLLQWNITAGLAIYNKHKAVIMNSHLTSDHYYPLNVANIVISVLIIM